MAVMQAGGTTEQTDQTDQTDQTEQMRPITKDEYFAMGEAGVIRDDGHVELLEGRLYTLSPQGDDHVLQTIRIRRVLERLAGEGHFIADHSPLILGQLSVPEPDVYVVCADLDTYDRVPEAEDIVVVVEVAVTSHSHVRKKAALYAAAGVPWYLLVDIPRRVVEVRSRPERGEYESLTVLRGDDKVDITGIGTVTAEKLLPPRRS